MKTTTSRPRRGAPARGALTDVAFIIYEGMTALDFIGVFDPVSRLRTMGFLPDLRWDVCATMREVSDGAGMRYVASKVCGPLGDYDMVIVPGGSGSRALIDDADFIGWLKTAEPCPLKVSVCTGALLLGAAGFLRGRTAATHPDARRALAAFGARPSTDRIVDDGAVITAGGVTAAIDLGLHLVEKLAGPGPRERIRAQMDYPYGS